MNAIIRSAQGAGAYFQNGAVSSVLVCEVEWNKKCVSTFKFFEFFFFVCFPHAAPYVPFRCTSPTSTMYKYNPV